jgi:hypothetical protein
MTDVRTIAERLMTDVSAVAERSTVVIIEEVFVAVTAIDEFKVIRRVSSPLS